MTDPNVQPPQGQPQGYPQQGQPQQGYPQPGYSQPQPAAPLTPAEDKQWAFWSHLGGIIGLLPSLIIFLVFKDRGGYTRQESKEALNWQITFTISMVAASIVNAILVAIGTSIAYASLDVTVLSIFTLIGGLLVFAVWAVNVLFSILGAVKVNGNGAYRYPFNFRFIK